MTQATGLPGTAQKEETSYALVTSHIHNMTSENETGSTVYVIKLSSATLLKTCVDCNKPKKRKD